MKLKLIILTIFLFSYYQNNAQTKAVTETGDEVILFSNGMWKYVDEAKNANDTIQIKTNPNKFQKNASSTFLLKSKKTDIGFWINPKKWSFQKAAQGGAAEYSFTYKEGDMYGTAIIEKVEIPLESLEEIALKNAQDAAPDSHIVEKEYRNVNGLTVLMLRIEGTLQGIKFVYLGYYFSNENGTVQYVVYTSQNLLKTSRKILETFLNGITVVK